MQVILSARPWRIDPNVINKPWDADGYALKHYDGGRKLCFGIVWDDGVIKPHPPVLRALQTAKSALESAGHSGQLSGYSPRQSLWLIISLASD